MANQFNPLDPLGVVAATRNQINKMAQTAGLPLLPDGAAVKKVVDPLKLLNRNPAVKNLPGYGKERF